MFIIWGEGGACSYQCDHWSSSCVYQYFLRLLCQENRGDWPQEGYEPKPQFFLCVTGCGWVFRHESRFGATNWKGLSCEWWDYINSWEPILLRKGTVGNVKFKLGGHRVCQDIPLKWHQFAMFQVALERDLVHSPLEGFLSHRRASSLGMVAMRMGCVGSKLRAECRVSKGWVN